MSLGCGCCQAIQRLSTRRPTTRHLLQRNGKLCGRCAEAQPGGTCACACATVSAACNAILSPPLACGSALRTQTSGPDADRPLACCRPSPTRNPPGAATAAWEQARALAAEGPRPPLRTAARYQPPMLQLANALDCVGAVGSFACERHPAATQSTTVPYFFLSNEIRALAARRACSESSQVPR